MTDNLNWNSRRLTHGWQRGVTAFYYGLGLSDARPPELARGGLSVLLDLVAVAVALWWARRVGLDEATNRERFRMTGQLPRAAGPTRGGPPLTGSC